MQSLSMRGRHGEWSDRVALTFLSKISVAFLRVLRVMGDENDLTNACKFIEGIFRRVLSVANMVYHYHIACLPNKMFLESCCRSVVFCDSSK